MKVNLQIKQMQIGLLILNLQGQWIKMISINQTIKLVLVTLLSLHLTSMPFIVNATSENSVIKVTGNLDKAIESIVENSDEKDVVTPNLEKKQTIIKTGDLPTTGAETLVWLSVLGSILISIAVLLWFYVKRSKKRSGQL